MEVQQRFAGRFRAANAQAQGAVRRQAAKRWSDGMLSDWSGDTMRYWPSPQLVTPKTGHNTRDLVVPQCHLSFLSPLILCISPAELPRRETRRRPVLQNLLSPTALPHP